MIDQSIIEVENLTKIYDGFTAVDCLNLKVEEGEIFGFLGPNGAGKTTTILMLLGLTEPTSGIVHVCGYNATQEPLKVKSITGYLPENLGFYEDLTAIENLKYITRLNSVPDINAVERIDNLLTLVGLSQVANHKVDTFSKGMKQRLGLAGVLIKEPKLIILDEPTAGLDPEGANAVLDLIVNLSSKQRITVLLSSHLLYQVQRICHRVGILSKGHLVAEGAVEELGREVFASAQTQVEVELDSVDDHVVCLLHQIEGIRDIERKGNSLVLTSGLDVRREVSRTVHEAGKALMQMRLHQYGLEDIYLRYFHEEAG